MGTLEFAAGLIFIALIEAGCPTRKLADSLRILGLFTASFAILPLCWFGYLVIAVGIRCSARFSADDDRGSTHGLTGDGTTLASHPRPGTCVHSGPKHACCSPLASASSENGVGSRRHPFAVLAGHRADWPEHLSPGHAQEGSLASTPGDPTVYCFCISLASDVSAPDLSRDSAISSGSWHSSPRVCSISCFWVMPERGWRQWGRQDLIGLSSWSARRYFDLAHPLGAADRFPVGQSDACDS